MIAGKTACKRAELTAFHCPAKRRLANEPAPRPKRSWVRRFGRSCSREQIRQLHPARLAACRSIGIERERHAVESRLDILRQLRA